MHHIIDPRHGRAAQHALAHRQRRRCRLRAGEHRRRRRRSCDTAARSAGSPSSACRRACVDGEGHVTTVGDWPAKLDRERGSRAGGRPMSVLAGRSGGSAYWYLTRSTGAVALLLLTFAVVLGVIDVRRWSTPRWPRFVVDSLHRNVSLLAMASSPCTSSRRCSTASRRSRCSTRSFRSPAPTGRSGWGSARSRSTCCSRSRSRACCASEWATRAGARSTG